MITIRIITGKFKGRKLKPPSDYEIRPMLDRVKESIFNIIGNKINGAAVLDLFSGTGSLGIESLSRGSSPVYFIDKSIQSINLIRYNTQNLKDVEADYKIIKSDVLKFLRFSNSRKWDIIFLDPPYKTSSDLMKEIFGLLSKKEISGSDTWVIYHYFFKRDIEEEMQGLKKIKQSFYGDKKVVYLSPCE